MATDTTTTEAKKSTKAAAKESAAAISAEAVLTTPVIIRLSKSKKKRSKKKYTQGTKGLQRLILGTTKAVSRSANSLAKGTKTFSRKSNKSARKRRDGLIRDSLRNSSDGFSDTLTELGRAPGEIARRVSTGQVRRAVRVFIPFGR